jgi:hypothetical protein
MLLCREYRIPLSYHVIEPYRLEKRIRSKFTFEFISRIENIYSIMKVTQDVYDKIGEDLRYL